MLTRCFLTVIGWHDSTEKYSVTTLDESGVMSTKTTIRSFTPRVQYKLADGTVAEAPWAEIDATELVNGLPCRTFPWYLGQRGYAGEYWCATQRKHVNYESRLELSRLMMKDFDPAVRRIASQPFKLRTKVDGVLLTRIPDFLAITEAGPLIIDVKGVRALRDPDIQRKLALTRKAIEARGWAYEIASEPPEVEYGNIRFLAGYRRDWLFQSDVLARVRRALNSATEASVDTIVRATELTRVTAFPGLMHLLWLGECTADLTRTLTGATTVRVRP